MATTTTANSVSRGIAKVLKAQAMMEGAGVLIRRTIGGPKLDYFDPFLLLDEFKSDKPGDYMEGFPDHPHRGFETVTYMLKGVMQHKDHKGNSGTLNPGSVQWMTAGKGIIHSEMPQQKEGLMHGYQMWVNLPAKDKMIPPRYQDFQEDKIPIVKLDNGVCIKVMAGESNGVKGAVTGISTAPTYLDITIPPSTSFSHPVTEGHNAFCYVIEGEGTFGPKGKEQKVGPSSNILLEKEGNQVDVSTDSSNSVRFLLAAAKPLNEPMSRHGPFVMNTKQEIMQAFIDYQNGTLQA